MGILDMTCRLSILKPISAPRIIKLKFLAYKYPKARSTKNGTAGQNEKGRKKKIEEGIEGNWRKSVKSYNEVLNEAKEKKKEKPKRKSKSLVEFNTKWSLFYF